MIPEVSIVIPVFDEEAILHAAVVDLRERLREAPFAYEILLVENGSRDATPLIAADLAERYPEVRSFSVSEPNYSRLYSPTEWGPTHSRAHLPAAIRPQSRIRF